MPRIGQIRGMLLEEALLHLLRGSGYQTVEDESGDETLKKGSAGLMVRGRGSDHQIDAIADFIVHQPFSHSQRLLVEAKCYSEKVRLPVLRNAVGVLKDVSEYWVSSSEHIPSKKRYHYQYALFSASSYTRNAERYAFAQDIYLIPLANSVFLQPVISAIYEITEADFSIGANENVHVEMSVFRRAIRARLKAPTPDISHILEDHNLVNPKLDAFVRACHQINYAIIAVLRGSFPVFLVPSSDVDLNTLPSNIEVRIFWDSTSWYLRDPSGSNLFSFDLPMELFELYAEGGVLSRKRALDLKAEAMSEFQAIKTQGGEVKVITFRLDHDWLDYIRRKLPISRRRADDER